MKKYSICLIATGTFLLLSNFTSAQKQKAKRPNIIVILADDLGYADVGYNGCKEIPTPNIDKIAQNGVVFTNAYVTAAVCAPTRAGLLTGKYNQRFGFESNPGPFRRTPDVLPGIPISEKNMAEHLKPLGYKTMVIGKWHLGKEKQFYPTNRGFDEFFGFLGGALKYEINKNEKGLLLRNNEPVEHEDEYLTDAFGREAVNFIDKNKGKPFFIYLSFNAVHAPLSAPEKYLSKFSAIANEKRRKLAAMNYAMDLNIGKVLDELKKHGLEENTIIFFLSDNGGKPKNNFSYNDPFRGIKGNVYEGGIHVPFCIQWKNHIKPGKYEQIINSLDILPTSLAAAGKKVDKNTKFDGVNLLPYLRRNKKKKPHEYLYWKRNRMWAIRDEQWKLVLAKRKKKPELYKISEDVSEKNNVIEQYPEIAQKLKKEFDKWASGMMESQWGWIPGVNGDYKVERN